MVTQVAVQPELIRIRERARVAVGGPVEDRNACALRNLHPRDCHLAGRDPEQPLHRALVAQGFLDNDLNQAALLPQLLPQRWALHEYVEQIADEISGGFVPSDE